MVFSSSIPVQKRFYAAGGVGGGWCAPSSPTSMGCLQLIVSLPCGYQKAQDQLNVSIIASKFVSVFLSHSDKLLLLFLFLSWS